MNASAAIFTPLRTRYQRPNLAGTGAVKLIKKPQNAPSAASTDASSPTECLPNNGLIWPQKNINPSSTDTAPVMAAKYIARASIALLVGLPAIFGL